jgi:putative oxygen-independent coproporphyrinogen III oxidase
MLKLPPLALYIHIPWCVKKCPYCDFNSHAAQGAIPEEAYIRALITDLKQDIPHAQGRILKSIFLGGGTPSLFSPEGIGKLLETIATLIDFLPDIEITMEANPGTLEHKSFKEYQLAGINRISLGVQSFQEDKLSALGRIHSTKETIHAIDSLIKADLKSFNIDLMFGLPNQTQADALYDLKTALDFSPPHLSWYNLTIEPNTIFHQKPPRLPNEETLWEIQEAGQEFLEQHSLFQYEVSAYSKPDHQCKHNVNYWQFGDYLGIGAGAHAKITNISESTITRFWKTRYPKSYLAVDSSPLSKEDNPFLAGSNKVLSSELPFEFMLNGLRLVDGISASLFEQSTGQPIKTIEPILSEAVSRQLLIVNSDKIIPTKLGKQFLNDLLSLFLPT